MIRPVLLLCACSAVATPAAADGDRPAEAEVEVAGGAMPEADDGGAPAAELEAQIGLGALASDWQGDFGAQGLFKVGLRLWEVVGLHALTRLGYAGVDQRLLTFLSIGVQLWPVRAGDFAAHVRLAGFHQHEESLAAVDENPGGAVFGVGVGIRHRYGVEAALGVEHRLTDWGRTEVFGAAELTGALAYYSSGPDAYSGLYLSLGVHHPL